MNIPTSLIVVLLVAAWIVVLVPMVARRRDRVPQTPADGTRVLSRAKATLRRKPRPGRRVVGVPDGENRDEEALVTVGGRTEDEPVDAADDWAAAQAEARVRRGTEPQRAPGTGDEFGSIADEIDQDGSDVDEATAATGSGDEAGDRVIASSGERVEESSGAGEPELADYDEPGLFDDGEAGPVRTSAPDEFDEAEWEAAQPRADWNEPPAAEVGPERPVSEEELRPVPQRSGRGGFDPEAAEATRAYKYRQRRRITLALLILTVAFGIAAPLTALQPLWIGAAVSFLLLVGYLSYLRRQVRIENAIRQRRMERLQRARQIRPEFGRSRRRPGAGSRSRHVVEMDDGDPSFEDLEEYEPIQYRRAV